MLNVTLYFSLFIPSRYVKVNELKQFVAIMPRMRLDERGRALGLLQAGRSAAAVARLLGFAKSTISRMWTKYQQTGKIPLLECFRPSVSLVLSIKHYTCGSYNKLNTTSLMFVRLLDTF